ncbi:MAG TPA: PD-(D/E)XK nuclease family protein, partial [Bdellovibrionota bacterium]|nr:PD-(D/E)XK nuclease family protein [Bdellovibrionota bacterium]
GNRVPKDPGEAPWRAREQGARLAESKRLFYVAVTRAQEQLVLACVPVARDIPPAPEAFDQDHWRAWIESAPGSLSTALAAPWTAPRVTPRSPVSTGAALAETGARPAAAPVLWRRARHSVTEWTLLERCARAYDWRYLHPAPESPADQIFASNEGAADAGAADLGLSAREIGTRVHACLEHRHWDGLVELERETGGVFRAGPVVQWARSSPLMAPPDLLTESHSELAFEIPVDGEVLVGAMDRLVLEKGGAGKWASAHVIDFKVAKAGRSAEDLLEAYTPQMELYAWATTRLLGLAPERMRATLVHLSTAGVKEVSVPLSAWVREASGVPAPLRRRIDAVRALCASGSEPHDPLKVKATPGPHCGVCEFRLRCPDVRP